MKIFILCGGFGTRLDYEGKLKAKPMVKIGNKPILIYIIENFILQGFTEFVFCLGYKSETITNYFLKDKKKYTKILRHKGFKFLKFSYIKFVPKTLRYEILHFSYCYFILHRM